VWEVAVVGRGDVGGCWVLLLRLNIVGGGRRENDVSVDDKDGVGCRDFGLFGR